MFIQTADPDPSDVLNMSVTTNQASSEDWTWIYYFPLELDTYRNLVNDFRSNFWQVMPIFYVIFTNLALDESYNKG